MTFADMRRRLGVVVGCAVLAAGLAGCGTDTQDDDAAASPSPVVSPTATAPTAAPATTGPAATAPATGAPAGASPADDGCPPDVNLLYERLKETPAIRDALASSVTGLQKPTCAGGWAAARTVVTDADSALVLFRYSPETGRWTPVNAGTDGVCDSLKVPAAIQAKLGPGC